MVIERRPQQRGAYILELGSSVSLGGQLRWWGLSVRPVATSSTYQQTSDLTASGSLNNHNYVDMGLSVKWATMNIGASAMYSSGDYFAWGETETKNLYWRYNSVTYDDGDVYDICGDEDYDAATALWGGAWRLPTLEEARELVDSCTWEWTTKNTTVNGYLVTGPSGKAIFLPAAGYKNSSGATEASAQTNLAFGNENGYYWVGNGWISTTEFNYGQVWGEDAPLIYFKETAYKVSMSDRSYGRPIRPVCD